MKKLDKCAFSGGDVYARIIPADAHSFDDYRKGHEVMQIFCDSCNLTVTDIHQEPFFTERNALNSAYEHYKLMSESVASNPGKYPHFFKYEVIASSK